MAIYITKKFETKEARDMEMAKFHDALAGSPAYVNSEIVIVTNDDCEFILCVGKDNENNLEV